ncbi:THO complex subunit 4-like [Macrobrachium nipponense]|uniref:THO complex subunit 4-like n=1 Tax=Macrobrachium nipponense TaxID=159736 RepID=UPI0030C832B9
MVSSVDMSLEDIIKTNKIRPGNRRGGGSGAGRRGARQGQRAGGGGGGAPAVRRGGGSRPTFSSSSSSSSSAPRGNIDGKWSHDLFQGPGPKSGPVKLVLSNLDFGVSDTDIHELFSEFGPLRSAAIHYDRSGRSLGTGHVTFDRNSDAVRAQRKYNGVRLDGRTMKITVEGGAEGGAKRSDVGPVKRLGQGPRSFGGGSRLSGGNAGNRNTRGGRGRRRGTGGREKTKVPTAEELDAELDAYVNQVTK